MRLVFVSGEDNVERGQKVSGYRGQKEPTASSPVQAFVR
jgi:hypothetical protein